MDFDDLDDLAPKPAARKFLPKPRGKLQAKKEGAPVVKPVKHEQVLKPKAEPMDIAFEAALGKKEVEDDGKLVSLESGGASVSCVNGAPNVEAEVAQDESMDVDDDSVVREIDVFYNPQADENTQLYMMQYPLRPSWRPYDLGERCKEVRVKPKSAKIEMDIEVDVDSRSHHESFHDLNTITKTLTLSGNILPKTCYAVGVLKGNQLHLNPIHAVVQLRPSTNADDDDEEEDERGDRDGSETLEDFDKKRPAASSKKQGKMTTMSAQRVNDKESSIPLKYHSSRSDLSEICLQILMAADPSPIPFTVSPNDYLTSFCPRRPNDSMRQEGLSMRSLLSLPLEERIKKWLCEGGEPAYRFGVLKYLAPGVPDENVIEILKQQAVLVQGLWVPRNSIVQPGCTVREALVRDYLILKFSQKLTITDEELSFKKDIRSILLEVLKKLAIQRVDLKDWKFKGTADPSFAKLYPSVALQQRQLLKEHESVIITQMSTFRLHSQSSLKLANCSATRAAISPTKKISMPAEKRDALLKALEVLFKNHSVNRLEAICRGLRDMAVSASSLQSAGNNKWMVVAASCVDGSRDELESVIREFATSIHGAYVAKSSLMYPELNPLRNVVIQLFLAEPPNGKLKKAHILEAFKVSLKKDVTINDYQKVMNEFCDSNGSAWMLKNPAGR